MAKENKKSSGNLDAFISQLESGTPQTPDSLEEIRRGLEETQGKIQRVLSLLGGTDAGPVRLTTSSVNPEPAVPGGERVMEGVFNGEAMVGGDGKRYSVPPNYASKSKLVEGDILKLTITQSGSFIYKQIAPIERDRLVATLARDEVTGSWYAMQDSRRWRLLTASVTYFRGAPGDEVVIVIPKSSKSLWGAVENIIKK